MSTSRDKVANTKLRGNCPDCGNPWWFDYPQSWVCTTCAKTVGKSTSEEREEKDLAPNERGNA